MCFLKELRNSIEVDREIVSKSEVVIIDDDEHEMEAIGSLHFSECFYRSWEDLICFDDFSSDCIVSSCDITCPFGTILCEGSFFSCYLSYTGIKLEYCSIVLVEVISEV